jgi:hypothetical protein
MKSRRTKRETKAPHRASEISEKDLRAVSGGAMTMSKADRDRAMQNMQQARANRPQPTPRPSMVGQSVNGITVKKEWVGGDGQVRWGGRGQVTGARAVKLHADDDRRSQQFNNAFKKIGNVAKQIFYSTPIGAVVHAGVTRDPKKLIGAVGIVPGVTPGIAAAVKTFAQPAVEGKRGKDYLKAAAINGAAEVASAIPGGRGFGMAGKAAAALGQKGIAKTMAAGARSIAQVNASKGMQVVNRATNAVNKANSAVNKANHAYNTIQDIRNSNTSPGQARVQATNAVRGAATAAAMRGAGLTGQRRPVSTPAGAAPTNRAPARDRANIGPMRTANGVTRQHAQAGGVPRQQARPHQQGGGAQGRPHQQGGGGRARQQAHPSGGSRQQAHAGGGSRQQQPRHQVRAGNGGSSPQARQQMRASGSQQQPQRSQQQRSQQQPQRSQPNRPMASPTQKQGGGGQKPPARR